MNSEPGPLTFYSEVDLVKEIMSRHRDAVILVADAYEENDTSDTVSSYYKGRIHSRIGLMQSYLDHLRRTPLEDWQERE